MALATPVPAEGSTQSGSAEGAARDEEYLAGSSLPAAEAELLVPVIQAFLRRHPGDDTSLIVRAAETATVAHAGQLRRSGEAYVTHPIAVAGIVADLGLDAQTVAAALLHDAVEDTGVTTEVIERDFGAAVALIVDGVTKLDRLQFDSKEAQQAATVRKMLVAMANDWRVLIIKLADRLHNMRTLAVMPEWKQRRTAQETLDIYAPLAHRLGIQEVKWQLEDLAFATLHAKRYAEIEQMVASRAPLRDEFLARVLVSVRERLAASGVAAEVTGRPKHLWSIYEKMVVRGKEFDDLYDLVGIRVIVEAEKDCWAALGSIHAIWPPVQGRFKDYINSPKFNLYQSLHTTVIGLDGKPIEVQVRTHEMHRRAEYGIAAHWGYKVSPSRPDRTTTSLAKGGKEGATKTRGDKAAAKDGAKSLVDGVKDGAKDGSKKGPSMTAAQRSEMAERDRRAERLALAKETSSTTAEIEWMQRIVDFQNETTDPIEFLEALKLDLEEDEVYVFTPKGKVIALAANATPVDFAYSIHTEVGHRCIGAKVNGRLVPLDTRLNSADTVEIFTSKAPTAGPVPRLVGHGRLLAGPDQDPPVVLAGATGGRHRARARGAGQGAPPRGPPRPEAGLRPHPGRRGHGHELRRPRRPPRRHRGQPDLGPGGGPTDPARPARRRLRGAAAGHRPPAAHRPPTGPRLGGRCLRRGPGRSDGPPVPVLHAGAGRRDRRLRHPGPWGVGPSGRLRQRRLAGQPVARAPHRGGVGPPVLGGVRGHHRGGGHRPVPPARPT